MTPKFTEKNKYAKGSRRTVNEIIEGFQPHKVVMLLQLEQHVTGP